MAWPNRDPNRDLLSDPTRIHDETIALLLCDVAHVALGQTDALAPPGGRGGLGSRYSLWLLHLS